MSDIYEIEVKIEAAITKLVYDRGVFTNYYVDKKRWVGSPKIMTFCQRLLGQGPLITDGRNSNEMLILRTGL